MGYSRIKSFAKINLALNVTGKNSRLHKIESIVGFVSLYDVILIKQTQSKKHIICLLYTSPSPRDPKTSRMPSSA